MVLVVFGVYALYVAGQFTFREINKMTKLPELSDDNFEKQLREQSPIIWWMTLFGPFVFTILLLVGVFIFNGSAFTYKLLGTVFATFFFFGRFVILGGSEPGMDEISSFFSPEFLFAMVVYMDAMVATVFIFHVGFLFKIPWIGPRLSAIAEDGQFILSKNQWMRSAAFIALVAFVAFPLAATGSVGGAILSRILGMGKLRAFLAIILGSIAGCSMMYFGAQVINHYFSKENPFVAYGGIAIIVAIIIGLNLWYRGLKKREWDNR